MTRNTPGREPSPIRKFWNLVLWGDSDITREQKQWVGRELARRRKYLNPSMTPETPPPARGQRRGYPRTGQPVKTAVAYKPDKKCDACHVATAAWEIVVGEVGYIWLCNHHKRKHEPEFKAREYIIREYKS